MKKHRFATSLRVGLAIAVAAVASISPAQAFHRNDPPTATYPVSGNGGVAVRVNVATAGPLGIELDGNAPGATSFGLGVVILSGTGQLQGGFMFTGTGGKRQLHVEGPLVGEVVDTSEPGVGGFVGIATDYSNIPAGDYIFVLSATTDAGFDGNARVFGNVTVAGANVGTGFHYRESDFHDGVSVIAGEPAVGTAKAIVASSATKSVGGKLFGWFGSSFFDPATALSYSGPGSSGVGQAHYFYYGAASGDYKFTIDSNVGIGPFTGIWAWGLDVVLP